MRVGRPKPEGSKIVDTTILELILILLLVTFLYVADLSSSGLSQGISSQADSPSAQIGKSVVGTEGPKKAGERLGKGPPPCFPDPRGETAALYRITILDDCLLVEPAWPDKYDKIVRATPGYDNLTGLGMMDISTFEQCADQILNHCLDEHNQFKRQCRFYVEIVPETKSAVRFVAAYGAITRYFLCANPSDVQAYMLQFK